jgi:NAD(P)-dependent dehydrogenase (short-subunit alcohol dehydrogenase family)
MKLKLIGQQVVVLMGASSGIGRDAALRFARRGAKVVVSARSQVGLASLVDQIRREGGEATFLTADVTQAEEVRRVAEHAAQTYGRLDTWVHLAAVTVYATFEETTPEEFKRVVETNLLGQVHGALAALPHLRREGRGALIHVSSLEALRSLPYHSAYGAAKHGIKGFAEVLRLELKREGVPISVTNVMPASINTPLFNKARNKLEVKPKGLPPIYEPQVVSEAILYAAEHPVRNLFAGGAARQIAFLQALSPRVVDAFLLMTGFEGQKTKELKPESAPDNLHAPIDSAEYNRIKGDFSAQATSKSLYPSLQKRPWLGPVAAALALGIAAVAATRRR